MHQNKGLKIAVNLNDIDAAVQVTFTITASITPLQMALVGLIFQRFHVVQHVSPSININFSCRNTSEQQRHIAIMRLQLTAHSDFITAHVTYARSLRTPRNVIMTTLSLACLLVTLAIVTVQLKILL